MTTLLPMDKIMLRPSGSIFRQSRFAYLAALAFLLFILSGSAHALACTFSSLSVNPPAPARILVAASVPANKIIYSTTETVNFTCTGGATNTAVLILAPVAQAPIAGVTNVSGASFNGATPQGAGFGYLTGLAGTGNCTSGNYANSNWPFIIFHANGTCSGTVGLGLAFYATSTGAVSGTIPAALSAPGVVGGSGWVIACQCTNLTCVGCTGPVYGQLNGPSIPIQTSSSTCALSTATNQTILLPNVSKSQFTGAGSTVGPTNFTIGYNCNTSGGALALDMAWTFVASGTTPSAFSIIKSSGSATGIDVQIVDGSGNPIVTGAGNNVIASVASGANTLKYTAQYYQTGAAVTAGTVSSIATYTATYH